MSSPLLSQSSCACCLSLSKFCRCLPADRSFPLPSPWPPLPLRAAGNGLPLGAVVTTPAIAASLAKRIHFNTYGGNPVCSAGGRAVSAAGALLEAFSSMLGRSAQGLAERGGRASCGSSIWQRQHASRADAISLSLMRLWIKFGSEFNSG